MRGKYGGSSIPPPPTRAVPSGCQGSIPGPSRARRRHPKAMASRGSLWCSFCALVQMDVTRINRCVTQCFHRPEDPPCSLTHTLATAGLAVSIASPFPECQSRNYAVGSLFRLAPLLTAHCFLVLGTIPLSGWPIHLLKDIVVSSELGAIMNKAVITSSCICVQVFLCA